MGKLLDIAGALQTVLIDAAEQLARPSGFVKRASKMTGPGFVQAMVFGSLNQPAVHLRHLAQTAALNGVEITTQGIDQRFTEASACLMRGVLEVILGTVVSDQLGRTAETMPTAVAPEILERFTEVELIDSTVIGLPAGLAGQWPGCNSNQGTTAALKLDVVFDLRSGTLRGPEMRPGRAHDAAAQIVRDMPSCGALRVQDRGYFSLDRLAEIAEAGSYWLTRYKIGVQLYDEQQQPIDLLTLLRTNATVDCSVFAGAGMLRLRLLGEAVPKSIAAERRRKLRLRQSKHSRTPSKQALVLCGWNVLLTNVPATMLSLREARALLGARWQIELLFKLWKSDLQIDNCSSSKPWHILTEIYAKLIAMTLQHWILRAGVWQIPDRSLRKAAAAVRMCAPMLLQALGNTTALRLVLKTIVRCMRAACHLDHRRGHPSTYQTLVAGDNTTYA